MSSSPPPEANWTANDAAPSAAPAAADAFTVERNPSALALALIPLLTIFGNALVILAVRRDKQLQTVTNLLIMSLASADLLVASCVMFFAVYFEYNSFYWDLGPTLCNLYIGADVGLSTASILNLLAISIDRYIAISHPLTYCQVGTQSRAYVSIALVWGISATVAIPVAFGANHIEREHECSFTNPVFMIGSSLLSFFVPCMAMIALYAVIFRRLREREKARNQRKRNATMSIESALITNALMGGARMARQIARHHLKDQLLLELSLQTSSFPTGSPSEEDEDEHSSSEGSSRRRHRLLNTASTVVAPPTHASAARRPTQCLVQNGGVPVAPPMNPLQLPKQNGGHQNGSGSTTTIGWARQRRATIALLRRCNTLPITTMLAQRTSILRVIGRQQTEAVERDAERIDAEAEHEAETEHETDARERIPEWERDESTETVRAGKEEADEAEAVKPETADAELAKAERAEAEQTEVRQTEAERLPASVPQMPPPREAYAIATASERSAPLRIQLSSCDVAGVACARRSFGDGLEQCLHFIDSVSLASSGGGGGSGARRASSMATTAAEHHHRCWLLDLPAHMRRESDASATPPTRHHTISGWPKREAADEAAWRSTERAQRPLVRLATPSVVSSELQCVLLNDDVNNNSGYGNLNDVVVCAQQRAAADQMGQRRKSTATGTHTKLGAEEGRWRRSNLSLPNCALSTGEAAETESPAEAQQVSEQFEHVPPTTGGGGSAGDEDRCSSSLLFCTSPVPNGASPDKLASEAEAQNGGAAAAHELGGWLSRVLEWAAGRGSAARGAQQDGGGGPIDANNNNNSSSRRRMTGVSAVSTLGCGDLVSSPAATMCRSVRIARPAGGAAPPLRNGSCPGPRTLLGDAAESAVLVKKVSNASASSPLRQRIRNVFRRSLVPIAEEHRRRPSRQLLKRATKQMRREQKATVTLAVVLAVFLCCWVPFFALHLSNAVCLLAGGEQCVHMLAMFLSTWLGYLNSSLNPLIYTVFDKRFRKAFRDLLGCGGSTGGAHGGRMRRAR